MKSCVSRAAITVALSLAQGLSAQAERFPLPPGGDSVIGAVQYVRARSEETLIDIAREFDLGYDQIVRANPDVNRWVPGDNTSVVLPHQYILPGNTRRGLVMNIAELRIYYYPTSSPKAAATEVVTYPVSIGRMDWRTPLGATKVIKKDKNPAWRPPKSIREEHAREGEILPEVIPGGAPDNPLGHFAMRLGFPGYLIHGVDERKAYGIGMRVTHGCIRMYPEDIERLFEMVPVNTPVLIMNEPIKVGKLGDRIYLEVHQPLDEGEDENAPALEPVTVEQVLRHVREKVGAEVDFDEGLVAKIAEEGSGQPYEIAHVRHPASMHDERGAMPVANVEESNRDWDRRPEEEPVKKSKVDSDYERAVSRYLDEEPDERASARNEAPRRSAPASRQARDEASRYIRERY